MYRYFAVILPLLAYVFNVAGATTTESQATTNQEKSNSDTHSLLLCANPRLTPPCTMILWDDLECMELPLEWDNIVTSVAPRGNGQHCILYRDYGCNGPSLEITRYTPELSNFENQVSSFRCFADFLNLP